MIRRVVVVDDEPLARQRIRDLLAVHNDFAVVAEHAGGEAAINACLAEPPDVVLLDVQMPDVDGLQVASGLVDQVGLESLPLLIFVTAHDRYAMAAFEASAIDYLLKPIGRERFDHAINRARRLLELRDRADRSGGGDVARLVESTQPKRATVFAARKGNAVIFVRPSSIDWADAAGNYVRLHVGGTVHMIRMTIGAFVDRLDPEQFVRIHRSAVINVARVTRIQSTDHGEFMVAMDDGTRLTASRTYNSRLRQLTRG